MNPHILMPRPSTTIKYGCVITFVIMVVLLVPVISSAQNYNKSNKKAYKSIYRKQNSMYGKACDLLNKKRNKRPHKTSVANNHRRKSNNTVSEGNTTTASVSKTPQQTPKPKTPPPTTPAPVDRPVPVASKIVPKVEHVSQEKLVQLHKKEDEVLVANDLPKPSSQKHEEVRKMVSDKLDSKTNVYPLNLAPLYFNFDQDEFSVVDMEPFLIAAEYALQGRTVLIEGHTDSRGADNYNVQLSIKRVQKIRQLMMEMGVPDDRISVVGYGEEIKTNTNKTDEGRQLNRRVDFTIF